MPLDADKILAEHNDKAKALLDKLSAEMKTEFERLDAENEAIKRSLVNDFDANPQSLEALENMIQNNVEASVYVNAQLLSTAVAEVTGLVVQTVTDIAQRFEALESKILELFEAQNAEMDAAFNAAQRGEARLIEAENAIVTLTDYADAIADYAEALDEGITEVENLIFDAEVVQAPGIDFVLVKPDGTEVKISDEELTRIGGVPSDAKIKSAAPSNYPPKKKKKKKPAVADTFEPCGDPGCLCHMGDDR